MTIAVQSLLDQLLEPNYWLELNSSLSVEEDSTAKPPAPIALEPEELDALLETLRTEGYLQLDSVLPEAEVFRMAIGVATLYESGFPPVFAFVYDEVWRVFQRLAAVLRAVLGDGYLQLPDFWAWYVATSGQDAGWRPHRDKSSDVLLPDGMPKSLTVWIPLSDAIPLNGCMSLLPAHLDPNYPDNLSQVNIPNPQDIRALPAPAGSVLGWNQAVLHWGGRSSDRAPFPRISLSCEFQRGDVQAMNQPLRSPLLLPSLSQRLGLIGKQIRQYRHMYPLSPKLAAIATALEALTVRG